MTQKEKKAQNDFEMSEQVAAQLGERVNLWCLLCSQHQSRPSSHHLSRLNPKIISALAHFSPQLQPAAAHTKVISSHMQSLHCAQANLPLFCRSEAQPQQSRLSGDARTTAASSTTPNSGPFPRLPELEPQSHAWRSCQKTK